MAIVRRVKITQEDTVAETVSLPFDIPVTELPGAAGDTLTQAGAITDAAVPFADLTAAANKVNEILAALRTAGVIAAA